MAVAVGLAIRKLGDLVIKCNLIREARAARADGAGRSGDRLSGRRGGPANMQQHADLGPSDRGVVIGGGTGFSRTGPQQQRRAGRGSTREEAQKLEAISKRSRTSASQGKPHQAHRIESNNLKKNQKGPVRVMDRISQDLPDWSDRQDGVERANISGGRRGLNPTRWQPSSRTSRPIQCLMSRRSARLPMRSWRPPQNSRSPFTSTR